MNMALLTDETLTALRASLPATASACVDAIVNEVPGYDRAFAPELRRNIERAVEQALSAFVVTRIEGGGRALSSTTLDGAYALGQGEAASGRSTDALLAAYRVGARVAWSQFAGSALAAQEPAANVAALAEKTFAYIDELSAQSLAGHTAALTARTRELARRRDQLTSALIAGESRAALEHLAESARWKPPTTLTALVVDGEPPQSLGAVLGDRALWAPASDGPTVVLVPDLRDSARASLLARCAGTPAALGPVIAWVDAGESVRHAVRALRFATSADGADCDELLPELALDAEPLVAERLRDRALAPLEDLSPAKRELLAETLLAWLMHQGRRDEVAGVLHVHPQTVRYRMNTLRELYGGALTEPRRVLELTLGLLVDSRSAEPADGEDQR